MKELSINPELLEISETYLKTLDVEQTAQQLNIPLETVVNALKKREVKSFLNVVYAEAGYRNRNKLGQLMDSLIDKKLEEMEEADLTSSNKDIADLVALSHKMSLENRKLDIEANKEGTPSTQINLQNNNYNSLVERIIKASD